MIPALTFGFISGISLGSFFHISSLYFIVFSVTVGIIFIYRYFVSGEDRVRVTIASIFLIGVIFGVGRILISDLYTNSKLSSFENKKVEVVGVIVAEPDIRETNAKLTIEVENISEIEVKPSAIADSRLIQTSSGFREKILVTVPLYPEFSYGDRVKVNVILSKPKVIDSGDGRVFDYKGYLKVRGIWYTSRFTQAELVSSGNG
ncbi:MAG: hypothetical protein CEO12_531, partial [Parcubacteria group bacterium Gr01-1014_46]